MKKLLVGLIAFTTLGAFHSIWAQPKETQTIQERLEAERRSQSGTAITIIFDDSGSMRGEKMEQAKNAFSKWIETTPEDTKLALNALNAGELVPLGSNNRAEVILSVLNMKATGGTPLNRTILQAANKIIERRKTITPYERHIVVVFTDGKDSQVSNAQVAATLQALGTAVIETVGIGFHGQGDYMHTTATQYFDAANTDQLFRALEQVASEIDQQSDLVISPEVEAEMGKINSKTPQTQTTPQQTTPQTQTTPISEPSSNFILTAVLFIATTTFIALGVIFLNSL